MKPEFEFGSGYGGAPKDKVLRDLGFQFVTHIERADWTTAKRTLCAIEARSAELIAQIQTP
jgi:ribonuclease HII